MAASRQLKVIISGGSGGIGQILARHLHGQGHSIVVLSRHQRGAEWRTAIWDGQNLGEWVREIDGSDLVINLAGRSVNCRHTPAHRREIKNSRTLTTGLIGEAIAQAARPPALWLNASTCSIYHPSFDQAVDESTSLSGGASPAEKWAFSEEVAESWERALFAADTPLTRRVALRIGMMMSPDAAGMFDKLLRIVRLGFGGTLGPGNQFVSWIHDVDFVRAVDFLLDHEELNGAVNLCSPCPEPNRVFMRCLRHAWCSSYIGLPTPLWALEVGAALLQTDTEPFLKSTRVSPARLVSAGFEFHFPNWRSASQDLVHRWRDSNSDSALSAAL
jgi:uncharacterized protein (TIGR01777 family)